MSALIEKDGFYKSGYPKEMKRSKFDMCVNERIKNARNKKGYSLARAVRELKERGVQTGVSTIQGYEAPEDNANHRYPSLIMLSHIASLYDCSIDYIFGLTDDIKIKSNDIHQNINNSNAPMYWDGKEISEAQKGLIIEKVNSIMSI